MISINNKASIAGLTVAAAMLLGALPASAQSVTGGLGVTASVGVTPSVSASAQLKANVNASLPKIIARGDADIDARTTALNALNARVQEMSNVSATEKATLNSELQTNISGLAGLKTKIDGDTDATAARGDDQSIFTAYRIYALVIPQGWILASADRVTTITGLMGTLSTKLQTRVTTAQTNGKDVTALTAAITDMNGKIADANTQAAAAQTAVAGLTPDQGNQAVITSNHTALVTARADIKVATQDLVAARKDVTTVVQGLKALGSASVSASSTTAY